MAAATQMGGGDDGDSSPRARARSTMYSRGAVPEQSLRCRYSRGRIYARHRASLSDCIADRAAFRARMGAIDRAKGVVIYLIALETVELDVFCPICSRQLGSAAIFACAHCDPTGLGGRQPLMRSIASTCGPHCYCCAVFWLASS